MQAYCKINLALDILGRREDGFHDLNMVMQSVSLADEIHIRRENAGSFSLRAEGFTVPEGKKSLEQRAAEAFFAEIRQPMAPISAELKKIVPAYAGLGGGSGDVATLLRWLRREFAPEMPMEQLCAVGLQVGSDVPFCLMGGTKQARGRGEVLIDLPPLPDCCVVICKPNFDLPTGELFARADQCEIQTRPDLELMIYALRRRDLPGVAAALCNVFEQVLPESAGEVFSVKENLLDCGALGASMSGSGPAVFGLFDDEKTARRAVERLSPRYPETFLAKPIPSFAN